MTKKRHVELTADTITDAQIREGYRSGLLSYDLLEFATFPAWAATRAYYRERCAEILSDADETLRRSDAKGNDVSDLKLRRGRGQRRFYLYFDIDPHTRQIAIETSRLPDMPEEQEALTPLGFCRDDSDGTYKALLEDSRDTVGVLRRATEAITILLGEATP